MKGNALLLSVLLLVPGIACAMDDSVTESLASSETIEEVAPVAQGLCSRGKAALGGAFSWCGSKLAGLKGAACSAPGNVRGAVVGAKDKVVSAWQNKPTVQDVKTACVLRKIKNHIYNLPTTMRNHKLATAAVIAVPVLAFAAWKVWKAHRKNSNPKFGDYYGAGEEEVALKNDPFEGPLAGSPIEVSYPQSNNQG